MKRLLLPIALIAFATISLSIVHIDNVNKLDAQSNKLRKKVKTEVNSSNIPDHSPSIDRSKTK
ncbi:hypothetical protein [Aquimarina sp. AU474]|uniref:hypothetical protein n=1 Tax=Aquimarina sp. AU474 TaxID=2108529 RepID=UPI000D68B52D|nr:hypothetical protein [Aquimarina sp. AU474]